MYTPCPKHPARQTQVEPQPITAPTAFREPRRVNRRKGLLLSHNKAKKRLSKAGRHVAPAVAPAVAPPVAPALAPAVARRVAPETLRDGMDFPVVDDHDAPGAASSSGCWPQYGYL